ncbi:hypothetical protein AMATHDRAFT_70876 [Amanita thiersii Skay4041]|uniref:Uncharacterized protein n=1 Tax=Amanita thiersii Skay4041 TaxID=703135 RepID=A0A2A9N9I9_9AGAR|nr:hypothetical protein AMATHDRAFT_70876 [Amanita thiersii Skay4041]
MFQITGLIGAASGIFIGGLVLLGVMTGGVALGVIGIVGAVLGIVALVGFLFSVFDGAAERSVCCIFIQVNWVASLILSTEYAQGHSRSIIRKGEGQGSV